MHDNLPAARHHVPKLQHWSRELCFQVHTLAHVKVETLENKAYIAQGTQSVSQHSDRICKHRLSLSSLRASNCDLCTRARFIIVKEQVIRMHCLYCDVDKSVRQSGKSPPDKMVLPGVQQSLVLRAKTPGVQIPVLKLARRTSSFSAAATYMSSWSTREMNWFPFKQAN